VRGHEWIVEFVFQTYMQLMDLRVRRVPVGRFPAPEVSVPLERYSQFAPGVEGLVVMTGST